VVSPAPCQAARDLAQARGPKRLDVADGNEVGLEDHPADAAEAAILGTPRDGDDALETMRSHRLDRRGGRH
jgi:hypothetical protein